VGEAEDLDDAHTRRDAAPAAAGEVPLVVSASGVLGPRWSRMRRMAKASLTKATTLMRWPQRVQARGSTS
jgi:hypothetical protein